MKRIGVLTSGGDAPGMNAAVRSVVRSALSKGIQVMGIHHGYSGLMNKEIAELNARSVSDIIHRGGTILYSARCPEFRKEEGVEKAVEVCKEFGIEGIIVIGGDGSFRGARDLSLKGIPCVGVPATIDNDISSTDYTIGFDTAMNTVVDMVDRLRDTAQSHERCSVVEVMGRHAGHLALQAGIAVGAISILVPEIQCDIKEVCKKIDIARKDGKKHFIIVVAEGFETTVNDIAKIVEVMTGVESRATILGHVQRGGNPTVRDRVMASYLGHAAVDLVCQGIGNRVVGYQKGEIVDFDIYEALQMVKPFSFDRYKIADIISM